MNITLIISTLNAGGAERVISILANAWAKKGENITLVTFEPVEYQPFYLLHPNVKLCNLNLLNRNKNLFQRLRNILFERFFTLRNFIKKHPSDYIISFMDTVNVTTIISTFGLKIPVIISERIDPAKHKIGFFKRILCKITYPFAHHIVVQTEQVFNYFSKKLQHKISIIPNPVSAPPDANSKENNNFESNTIIAAGRLEKQKGFDLLLKAFAFIHLKYPEWKLMIWGEGQERHELEKLCNLLHLNQQVHFPGITANIHSELKKGELFVLPSLYEGFPNTLCEAMAVGLPVIAFDCGSGPRDIIRDKVDGLLVPPQNIKSLSESMEVLMKDQALRKKMGNYAKEVVDRFSLEKILEKWNAIFC